MRVAVAPVYPTLAGGSTPIFPGYVFVAAGSATDRDLEFIPHVVKMIAFDGIAARVNDDEIRPFLIADRRRMALWPSRYLPQGIRVRVKSGPFAGIEGILQRRHGRSQVVLNVELLRSAAAVRVNFADVERL
jgi:transcription antitermination factor NusG